MRKVFLQLLLLQIFVLLPLISANQCPTPKKIHKKMDLESVEKMALESNCTPLLNAVNATKSLFGKYKHPGIKQWRFLKTAFYIETNLQSIVDHQNRFLTKKQTGLKNAIEYDPATGQTFIVLHEKKAFLGHGKKKMVYKSILYKTDPKVLARGVQSAPMYLELEAHKALKGQNGVMKTYAFTIRNKGSRTYTTIYSDLYQGTFRGLFEKYKRISFRNKLHIICDILKGLESIHAQNYVHRDLHANNYLLRVDRGPNGKKILHAVIADLGRTISVKDVKKLPAQGARSLYSPEALDPKKLTGDDYFATDIYALGCIFYRLYHNKLPKWTGHFMKDEKISKSKKKKILLSTLKKETSKRWRYLSKKSKKSQLTVKEDAEFLILRMLRKRPEDRGTASICRQEAERILHRLT